MLSRFVSQAEQKRVVAAHRHVHEVVDDRAHLDRGVGGRREQEGLEGPLNVLETLQKIYGMEGTQLWPSDVKAFRDKTRLVHTKWAEEIGADLVRSAENIIDGAK